MTAAPNKAIKKLRNKNVALDSQKSARLLWRRYKSKK